MLSSNTDQSPITPAESVRHGWEVEEADKARQHDLATRAQELKVLKLQTSWNSLIAIPLVIVRLPIYLLLGVGFIIAMLRKHDPGEDFWRLLQ